MGTAAQRLQALLGQNIVEPAELAALCDGLSHGDRMEAITSLGRKLQRRLFELAAPNPKVTIDQLVPPDAVPLREVIFHGKNSLPAFTRFQKRFCRPPKETQRDELWGYNHTDIAWLIGPGYFVCHDDPAGAAVDYREVPSKPVPGWPAVVPNDRGLSHLVYKNMIDYLRRVSRHVLIGSATKLGKPMDSYFVLCREP